MIGHKQYDLNDPKDLVNLNTLLNPIGVFFQQNLLGVYVLIDIDHYMFSVKRKAGRRTVISQQVINNILQSRYEGMTIRDIAEKVHVSSGTVIKVLREHPSNTSSVEGQITIDEV